LLEANRSIDAASHRLASHADSPNRAAEMAVEGPGWPSVFRDGLRVDPERPVTVCRHLLGPPRF